MALIRRPMHGDSGALERCDHEQRIHAWRVLCLSLLPGLVFSSTVFPVRGIDHNAGCELSFVLLCNLCRWVRGVCVFGLSLLCNVQFASLCSCILSFLIYT